MPSEKVAGQWVPESSVRLLNDEPHAEARDSSVREKLLAIRGDSVCVIS